MLSLSIRVDFCWRKKAGQVVKLGLGACASCSSE